jgi:AcrR family transcriptional regulator
MNNQINIIKKGRPKTIDLERIKNVAMINYWSDGPTNVSLNEICFKAKISKPGLYREFGGEDGLMKSVLLLYKNTLIQQILDLLKLEKTFDETLDLLIAFVIGNKDEEHIKKGCLLAKFRQSREKFGKKTQEQIDIILRERYLNFELWIKKAKSKGEFDFPLSSKFVARYIISQLDYAVSGLANGEKNNNIKDVLTLSLSVFRKK